MVPEILRFETTPQKHLNNRKLLQPRGRCVGGSSTANLMLYVRGNSGDYDRWADLIGHDRFKHENILPYFKKSQNAIGYGEGEVIELSSAKNWCQLSSAKFKSHHKDEYNGRGGYLSTSQVDFSEHPFGKDFYKAFIQGAVSYAFC